ncbi:hypothetical protein ABT294_11135 [Nonomuraea sp. NPDC000554]|uniref:hypothetical protein n=1 Tax=Nonomuraea sp. NPDC000554 TaxID=3154259 RepID=UPI00332A6F74
MSSNIVRGYHLGGGIELARWHTRLDSQRAGPESRRGATPRGSRPDKRQKVDLSRAMPRQAMIHLTHASATDWLQDEGLHWTSSGHCSNRWRYNCTSLESVRTDTISRLIDLKRESGCPIMVTGGTETGHAAGRYSHSNGYKLDITPNACMNRYITENYDYSGKRGDGAGLYRSPEGVTFAREANHWDILFR